MVFLALYVDIRRVMNRRYIALLLIFSFAMSNAAFSSLSEMQSYAAGHPENVQPTNNNWTHPDFSDFHKSNTPHLIERIAQWFGLSGRSFDIASFGAVLKEVAQSRVDQTPKGYFSEHIKSTKNDRFIIWADLFGAYHSLVRDLTFLHTEGVIDESLKIKDPNVYFIFNGNVIDGSSYVLETVAVVLQLMKVNPNQVIYTRGYHEMKERWHNFELLNELKIRAAGHSSESIPFGSELNQFFASLPIALYLTQDQESAIQVVIISNNEKTVNQIKRHDLSQVLSHDKQKLFFTLGENSKNEAQSLNKTVEIRAFITSEDRSLGYRLSNGLTAAGTFEGATRWIVFSSPTERNQKLYKFFYDAFAQLDVTNGLDSWTLSLFNQKVPELDGFKKDAVYNLVTGREIFTQDSQAQMLEIDFGATMDLSKGASPIGKKVKEGLELAFDRELATGSISGVVPQITAVDDEYTPTKTRSAVQEMMKNSVDIFIGSQGSASLESYLDLIKQGELLVLFPFTGSPLFRQPDLKHLIHYRGSYIREGQELINYALKDLKSKKIAIFYQDDAFGRGALAGARQALKAAGVTDYIEVPHERNVLNYNAQAAQIKDFNPDTILFSTNSPAIRGLIRQLGVQYFAGKKLLGLSVYEDAFERFLKDKGLNFTLIRMVPDPATSDLQIAKEYREWADKKNVPYDKVSFEQYINANILFYILRKIEGPITADKIIAIAERFKNEPFKGLELNFNPQTRELSDTLWIDSGTGPWIERKVEKQLIQRVPSALRVSDSAVHADGLKFGSTMDLSKGLRLQGQAVQEGIEVRLDQAQNQGMSIIPEIVIEDDAYTPSQTRSIIDQFIANGIYTIVSPTGSATLESYIDLIKDGKVTVLFPITGAPQFRTASLSNMVHLRASYATEGHILTQYALEKLKAQKVALFYQNDAFGKSLLKSSKALLENKGIKTILEVPYDRNEKDFSKQAERIKQFDPDVVLFFSTAIAARKILEAVGADALKEKHLLGNSDLGELEFQSYIKQSAIPFMSISVVPNPHTSELQIAREYRDAISNQERQIGPFSFEAYIGIDLLLHVLQEIDPPATRNKMVEKLAAMDGVNYKGLDLKFDPQTRTLLHTVWLNPGSSQWEKIDLTKDSKTS